MYDSGLGRLWATPSDAQTIGDPSEVQKEGNPTAVHVVSPSGQNNGLQYCFR